MVNQTPVKGSCPACPEHLGEQHRDDPRFRAWRKGPFDEGFLTFQTLSGSQHSD